MNQDQENRIKLEFGEWWMLEHNDTSSVNRAYAWQAYLAACMKRMEEIEELKEYKAMYEGLCK